MGKNIGANELHGLYPARHILLEFFSLIGTSLTLPECSQSQTVVFIRSERPPWRPHALLVLLTRLRVFRPGQQNFTGYKTHTAQPRPPSRRWLRPRTERRISCCPRGARWAETCTAAVWSAPASSWPPPAPSPSSASPPGLRWSNAVK